jgi:hypothetical protein
MDAPPIVLTEADERLLASIAEPSMTAAGNAEFANNLATAWACIYSRNQSIEGRERGELTLAAIDRIGRTTTKAAHAEEIRGLKAKAGLTAKVKPDAARVIPINGSGPLRAAGRIQRGAKVSGLVPDAPGEGDGR